MNKEKSDDSVRRTKPPLLMFSQRNNPYCELLQISAAKIQFFSKPHKLFKVFFVPLATKRVKSYN